MQRPAKDGPQLEVLWLAILNLKQNLEESSQEMVATVARNLGGHQTEGVVDLTWWILEPGHGERAEESRVENQCPIDDVI